MISATVQAQTRYELPVGKGVVIWKGGAIGNGHEGTIKIKSGYVVLNADMTVARGEFELDMNTIRAKDTEGPEDSNLDTHLKSEDFFSVAKYPSAYFTVLRSKSRGIAAQPDQLVVDGLLMVCGISNPVSVWTSVKQSGKMVNIKGEFTIERTRWGITYKAKTLFSSVKDDLIANEITIAYDLQLVLAAGPGAK